MDHVQGADPVGQRECAHDSAAGIAIRRKGAVSSWVVPRSLSDLGLSYCGKADIGRIFRSISSNSYGYSPQSIEKSDWIPLSIVTNAQVRQAPRCRIGLSTSYC